MNTKRIINILVAFSTIGAFIVGVLQLIGKPAPILQVGTEKSSDKSDKEVWVHDLIEGKKDASAE